MAKAIYISNFKTPETTTDVTLERIVRSSRWWGDVASPTTKEEWDQFEDWIRSGLDGKAPAGTKYIITISGDGIYNLTDFTVYRVYSVDEKVFYTVRLQDED